MDDDDIAFDPDKDKIDPNTPLGGGLNSVFVNKRNKQNNSKWGSPFGDEDEFNKKLKKWKEQQEQLHREAAERKALAAFFTSDDVRTVDNDIGEILAFVESIPPRLDVVESRMINTSVQLAKIVTLLTEISQTLKEGKTND